MGKVKEYSGGWAMPLFINKQTIYDKAEELESELTTAQANLDRVIGALNDALQHLMADDSDLAAKVLVKAIQEGKR